MTRHLFFFRWNSLNCRSLQMLIPTSKRYGGSDKGKGAREQGDEENIKTGEKQGVRNN
jgi:hypothetical protein